MAILGELRSFPSPIILLPRGDHPRHYTSTLQKLIGNTSGAWNQGINADEFATWATYNGG
jgi:hypothetical protein